MRFHTAARVMPSCSHSRSPEMGSRVDSMPRIGSMAYASSFFGDFLRLR